MIGEKVSPHDQHWKCFLLMMTIVDYVFVPVTSTEVVEYLKELIESHHELFKEVYPSASIIPKLHYVIHIPQWIERLERCINNYYTF